MFLVFLGDVGFDTDATAAFDFEAAGGWGGEGLEVFLVGGAFRDIQ